MLSSEEKPSSWLSSSSMVRCTSLSPLTSLSKRFVPMASISSMKMMHGDFSFARANASRTSFAPSPINIYIHSEHSTHLANNVAGTEKASANDTHREARQDADNHISQDVP